MLWPSFFFMEDHLKAQKEFSQAYQGQQKTYQNLYNTQGFNGGNIIYGGLGGAQTFTYPTLTPSITITPVAVKVEHYDTTKAVQVLYRFGKGLVEGCVIKGTNNIKTATDVFLGQFTADEPEIVAVVEIALTA